MSDRKTITAEQLRELLEYDAETGVFRWRNNTRQTKAGAIAGSVRGDGYRIITIMKRAYYAHRLAWLYVYGELPTSDVDHINGIPGDDRIANLRQVSHCENHQNRRKAQSNNRSCGLLGVTYDRRKGAWSASISTRGSTKFLGYHSTAEGAHSAYLEAKRVQHPFGTI